MLVECISQLMRRPECRVLACAPSNSAADLLAQRMAMSMDPSRMYRLNAVSRAVDSIAPALLRFSSFEGRQCTLRPCASIERFQLVVATCISAAMLYALGTQVGAFTHIFIDEAGHATEPEALAAMCGLIDAHQTRLILAGDPQQLGPIIRSPLAVKHGLATSLLERLLLDQQPSAASSSLPSSSPYHRTASHAFPAQYITKLLLNYRSHPAILETPNRLFYNDELIASADRLNRESLQRWPLLPVPGFPLLLHHLVGKEEREGESPSWFNSLEAQTVVEYVAQLLSYKQGGVEMAEIGVITPYRKQVQKLRALLHHRFRGMDCSQLKVGSVEEFQGQERRVVIVSTVRSQLLSYEQFDVKFNLGFVGHPKRLNVAITRAKCALLIVGNARLLSTDPHWAQVIHHIHSRGAVVGDYTPHAPDTAPQLNPLFTPNAQMAELTQLLDSMARMHADLIGGSQQEQKAGGEDEEEEEAEGGTQLHINEEPAWKRDD